MKRPHIFPILIGILAVIGLVIVAVLALRQQPAGPAATPTETLSVAIGQLPASAGPQIVRQSPLPGSRLTLNPIIEITFDREMDQQKTGAAWSFQDAGGINLPGAITWVDKRTMQFQPGQTLNPASRYTAVITTAAAGLDSSAPARDIVLEFQTADPLAVGQVFPADSAEDVEVNTTVTVIFTRPVVPVTAVEEQAGLSQPIRILPEVAGKGEWVSSSVYVFTPDEDLNNGTRYSVRVPAGLQDSFGGSLPDEYAWQFTTRAPQIAGFSLKDGEQNPDDNMLNVLLDQAFIVRFLQAMDPVSVSRAVTLVNSRTGNPIPFNLKWNMDNTVLTVEPAGWFSVGCFYRLAVADSAQASDGSRLKTGLVFNFSTINLPQVASTNPVAGTRLDHYQSWTSISFNAPMSFNSLKDHLKIEPSPEGGLKWSYDKANWTLYLYGLDAGQNYMVHLEAGTADIYGHTIDSGYSYSFINGDYAPYGWIPSPYGPLVYRADEEQYFFFEYINLDLATISLYRLSADEFGLLQTSGDAANFLPSEKPLRIWTPGLQAERNNLARLRFALEDSEEQPLSPGYYLLTLLPYSSSDENHFRQGVPLIVATDNITFKSTDSEGLAWLVDLETGKPTADVPVSFYDADFSLLGKATTDRDGIAYLADITDPAYVRTDSQDRLAFASRDWGSGVSADDYGIWAQYYQKTDVRFGYVYTDRPLYRPGQDVYLTGVIRQDNDLHYSLPTDKQVYVTVENWEEEVYHEYLPISEAGSFTGTYTLGEDVPLGSYYILLRTTPKADPFASVSFRVAEYRKPEFQVNVSADKAGILPGGKVNFSLDAVYYSGGSVSRAGVEWFLESAPFYFTPPEEFAQYSFADWDRDAYWSSPQTAGTDLLAQGEAVTGADGHLNLSQTVAPGKTAASRTISLSANVTDVAGSLVSGGTQLVMHQSRYYAGIRSASYVGQAGEEQTFQLVVLDWDGNPVPRQAVSVDIVKRDWYSVQEEDEQGELRWVTSVKDVPAARFASVVTGEDGKASVSFTPQAGGTYRALVTVRDAQWRTQSASAFIWVSSDSYVAWRQTNDRSFNLIADRDSYAPGDTAEILIAQPFEGDSYALVTYERGHIYRREVVLLRGNSTLYRLPVTKDMAPVAYVSVVVVGGADALERPDFKVGITRINIDTSQQTLDVRIATDKSSAGPGDEVTYTVETRDAQGKPAAAEVSFALVDKAILALSPSNVAPLLDAFYPKRALSVMTSVGIVQSADDFLANLKETVPTGYNGVCGGGGKGEGDLGIIDVRQYFKDTAFFRSQVLTDNQGKAQVKVVLPENLTTWHMDVRAVSADSRVGQAVHELISNKPLFLQLQTPRFFVAGDTARIGAAVHNNTGLPLAVEVSLDAAGVRIVSPAEQSVTVPAKQQAYVTWDVETLPGASRVDLTARTAGGGYTDATKPPLGTLPDQGIPIYTYSVKETVGTSGVLSSADSITEAFQLPPSLEAQNSKLRLEISPSLAASMTDGLVYLEDYPYLCLEQTVSRFLPNLLAARALKEAGRPPLSIQGNLEEEVNAALQKIYSRQNYDGGWSWWDGASSDLQTSAYVVLGLLEARESDYPVKQAVLDNAVDFLENSLPSLTANDATWRYNRQAFVLYVLARLGSHQNAEGLYENRHILGVYGEAFLLQALALADPDDPRIPTLLSDFGTDAILSAAGTHWEEKTVDYWNWNTDTRTTAIVVQALLDVDPENKLTAGAVRWLMASRTEGRWPSTQETAWTLMALTKWLSASQELQTQYSFAVGLNGSLLKSGAANADNLGESLRWKEDLDSSLADKINYLVINRGAGPGNLYYSAYMENELPVKSVEALDRGVIVERQYFRLENSKKPVTTVARGELVRVRLTVVVPSAVHYLVINDPLPAGLEAIDTSLSTNAAVPEAYTRADFDERGWGWWYFTHADVRDEKVVLSADYLPPGTYVYIYMARAGTAGTFNVIPVTAEEFYFPDVGGRSAGSQFVVTP